MSELDDRYPDLKRYVGILKDITKNHVLPIFQKYEPEDSRSADFTEIKLDQTLVTKAEIEIHKTIDEIIRKEFPNIDLVTEEGGEKPTGKPLLCLWDEIDGTTEYIIKSGQYCSQCALIDMTRKPPIILASIILKPHAKDIRDNNLGIEVYSAVLGEDPVVEVINEQGQSNTRIIHTSKARKLKESKIVAGKNRDDELMQKILKKPYLSFHKIGSSGHKLSLIAKGEAELYFRIPENEQHPINTWDIVPGAFLLQCAGGSFKSCYGYPKEFNFDTFSETNFLATNGLIDNEVLESLRQPPLPFPPN